MTARQQAVLAKLRNLKAHNIIRNYHFASDTTLAWTIEGQNGTVQLSQREAEVFVMGTMTGLSQRARKPRRGKLYRQQYLPTCPAPSAGGQPCADVHA